MSQTSQFPVKAEKPAVGKDVNKFYNRIAPYIALTEKVTEGGDKTLHEENITAICRRTQTFGYDMPVTAPAYIFKLATTPVSLMGINKNTVTKMTTVLNHVQTTYGGGGADKTDFSAVSSEALESFLLHHKDLAIDEITVAFRFAANGCYGKEIDLAAYGGRFTVTTLMKVLTEYKKMRNALFAAAEQTAADLQRLQYRQLADGRNAKTAQDAINDIETQKQTYIETGVKPNYEDMKAYYANIPEVRAILAAYVQPVRELIWESAQNKGKAAVILDSNTLKAALKESYASDPENIRAAAVNIYAKLCLFWYIIGALPMKPKK